MNNQIHLARVELNLTTIEICKAMNIHRDTWGKWVRGEREPGHSSVQLIKLMLWMKENDEESFNKWLRYNGV